MATNKHTNLTVTNLTVTGTLITPDGALPAPGAAVQLPVAAHVPVLPHKTTVAELRDRVEYLTSVLVEAGLIEAVPAPVTAPDAVTAPAPAQGSAEAVAAGVVDAG
jgi:hypothetical protein